MYFSHILSFYSASSSHLLVCPWARHLFCQPICVLVYECVCIIVSASGWLVKGALNSGDACRITLEIIALTFKEVNEFYILTFIVKIFQF